MEGEHKIILQQIVISREPATVLVATRTGNREKAWVATCRCGWYANGTEKECTLKTEEHGGPRMIGPTIVTFKSTVAVPRPEFPRDRWVWTAYNECDRDLVWYWGNGRSEDEAIDDLHNIDSIRRMARFDQNEGFPRDATWLDFFKYEP